MRDEMKKHSASWILEATQVSFEYTGPHFFGSIITLYRFGRQCFRDGGVGRRVSSRLGDRLVPDAR